MQAIASKIHTVACIHEQATGLAPQSRWDLISDRQALQEEPALQVGHRAGRLPTGRLGGSQGGVARPAAAPACCGMCLIVALALHYL